MQMYIRHFMLIVLLSAVSFNAMSQERLPCQWGNIDITDPACKRPQLILKKYRNASTYTEHQSLLIDLNQLRNDDFQRLRAAKKTSDSYDPFIDEALMDWLDWYQIAFNAREENRQLLESEVWRTLIQLAHRDPYAAIKRLNKVSQSTVGDDKALSLLLTGMLTNRLKTMAEAANYAAFNSKTNDRNEEKREQRFEEFIQTHKQEFNIGELCYGANYNGRHFSAVEKQFPQSKYAQAAAYLSMMLNPCGECEGDFSCYLSKALGPTKQFLSKYPQSELVPIVIKRVDNRLSGQFIVRDALGDYLTKNEPHQSRDFVMGEYNPLDAANVLIDFERSLNRVEPSAIISTKYLLGDLYVKLEQMGNAKRILNWLSEHAPNSPEVSKLSLSLTNPAEQKRITDAKLFADRKKKLSQTYWLQECELDKLWLGQEGIDCQQGRLSNR
ncbi:hypothetical protein [Undibacterium sp. Di24W]|uniref:hypothetical protein n=1 Tax=Undibacterium sp. Di24W TaxID=3413033 RepID=UPI003BF1B5E0